MKTNSIITLLGTAVVTLALAMPAVAANGHAAKPSPSGQPLSAAAPAPPPEQHPQIQEALASLRRAKEHLEHAAHDFGGHRVDAINAVNEAIRQLEICLKYDKH